MTPFKIERYDTRTTIDTTLIVVPVSEDSMAHLRLKMIRMGGHKPPDEIVVCLPPGEVSALRDFLGDFLMESSPKETSNE